jgi:hypothetical protein
MLTTDPWNGPTLSGVKSQNRDRHLKEETCAS